MNFKELQIKWTLGENDPQQTIDVRHDLGNMIYSKTSDLGVVELAKKIYFSDGEIELDTPEQETLKDVLGSLPLTAPVKLAIINQLNK